MLMYWSFVEVNSCIEINVVANECEDTLGSLQLFVNVVIKKKWNRQAS